MWAGEPSFFVYIYFQSERYCIFCPISRKVSVFISTDREFYLVFTYVYVYICFLTGKLPNFPLSAGHKINGWSYFFFFNSVPVACNFCLLCLKRFRYF